MKILISGGCGHIGTNICIEAISCIKMNKAKDISLLKELLKNVDEWYLSKNSTSHIRYDREPIEIIKDYLSEVLKEWKND